MSQFAVRLTCVACASFLLFLLLTRLLEVFCKLHCAVVPHIKMITLLSLHGISPLKDVGWYPPLGKVLLQPCHLRQATGVKYSGPHTLPLIVCVDAVFCRFVDTISEGGHNKALGLDAHDLRRLSVQRVQALCCDKWYLASEISRLLSGTKELVCLLALHVAHFSKIEVANGRTAPYDPVSVVLFTRHRIAH
jgi:hypothetical protein